MYTTFLIFLGAFWWSNCERQHDMNCVKVYLKNLLQHLYFFNIPVFPPHSHIIILQKYNCSQKWDLNQRRCGSWSRLNFEALQNINTCMQNVHKNRWMETYLMSLKLLCFFMLDFLSLLCWCLSVWPHWPQCVFLLSFSSLSHLQRHLSAYNKINLFLTLLSGWHEALRNTEWPLTFISFRLVMFFFFLLTD